MKKVLLGVLLLFAIMNSSAFAGPKSPLIHKLIADVKSNPRGPIAQKLKEDAKELLDKKAKLRSDVVSLVRRMESEGKSVYDPDMNMDDFMKFYAMQKQLVQIDRHYARLAKLKQSVDDAKEDVIAGLMYLPEGSIQQIDYIRDARDRQAMVHFQVQRFIPLYPASSLDKLYPVSFTDALIHFANDFEYVKAGSAR